MASFEYNWASRPVQSITNIERNIANMEIKKQIEQDDQENMNNSIKSSLDENRSNNENTLFQAALKTVDFEGRRDKNGNLQIYQLPPGDMGGEFEIAGINDKYHPDAFKQISSLPPERRDAAAANYVQKYTSPVVSKLPSKIQPFAQDMAFNRGLGGATKYMQQGLNSLGKKIDVDGVIGPKTLSAISEVNPRALMKAANQAQLEDEYKKASVDPRRMQFMPGIENRIRNRLSIFGNA